ncbi:histidine phosphotransferase family protein [Aliiroseovarius sediminis]|uniref:histidine phosphotransferase family protein n=1 Tax=Aliiroseovarius sediminis TaxID=2925839 RepID=UPI001F5756B6|nr:histidine phosphotransferase family protein [Aliiroseovarius sediminis]MCI2393663.1 histidine phosphotransferase family protein [Aliiroseovarius sediminis]
MTHQPADLTALIGSRICHDLISPLGAIGNGVELLQMSGQPDSPEMALIAESIANANLRIRFFRVAFGAAADGQMIAGAEIASLLSPGTDNRKVEVAWQPAGDQPRGAVKLAFLLLQCFETAMPWGGHVQVRRDGEHWQIRGEAEKLKIDPALWALLSDPQAGHDVPPAQVHFALIAPELARQGREIGVTIAERSISVEF